MRRLIPLMLALLATGRVQAEEYDARVRVREVEVRSGPTAKYYATGKLRYGDKVHVKANHGDYVAITPPADAFSLVAKSAVRPVQGREGVIEIDAVDTYQGSTLTNEVKEPVRGTRLPSGALVTILEEVSLPTASGPKPFYKIVPLSESRYIPADALRESTVVPAGGAAAAAPGPVQQAAAVPGDQIGAWLTRADLAYKKGDANGDWAEAKRLYEELAKCDNHEARIIALNRLSYIRKKAPGLFTASASTPVAAAGTSGYRPTPPPTEPMPPPANASRPTPPAQPAPNARTGTTGWLRRVVAPQPGQPGYYVADAQGRVLFHVAPATGADLNNYVDQKVEISGGPMVYRQDLRSNYMIATGARRVQ
jgi:hypothetical protein